MCLTTVVSFILYVSLRLAISFNSPNSSTYFSLFCYSKDNNKFEWHSRKAFEKKKRKWEPELSPFTYKICATFSPTWLPLHLYNRESGALLTSSIILILIWNIISISKHKDFFETLKYHANIRDYFLK